MILLVTLPVWVHVTFGDLCCSTNCILCVVTFGEKGNVWCIGIFGGNDNVRTFLPLVSLHNRFASKRRHIDNLAYEMFIVSRKRKTIAGITLYFYDIKCLF